MATMRTSYGSTLRNLMIRATCLSLYIMALFFSATPRASAVDPTIQKLYGRWTTPAGAYLGNPGSLAANETWIIAGAPESDEGATDAGAVQVFNAVTGAWVRKISPALPSASLGFGHAVGISGNLGLIGVPDNSGSTPGAVLVYNLKTGALVRTISPAPLNASNGDRFGCALAISGDLVVVGSRTDTGTAGVFQGSAYVFNLLTGVQLAKLEDSQAAANNYFGTAVAAEGNVAIVSAPYAAGNTGRVVVYNLTNFAEIQGIVPTGAVAESYVGSTLVLSRERIFASGEVHPNPGKVYEYNLVTGQERVLQPSNSAGGDSFGSTMAASQGLLLVTGRGLGQGVYVFDFNSSSTTESELLSRPDSYGVGFGDAVTLAGNTAVIASAFDSTQATNAGALYVYRPLTKTMPLTRIASKGEFAPGAADIQFNAFGSVLQNRDGEVGFSSSLTGSGSNKGKDVGVWDTLGAGGQVELLAKSRDAQGIPVSTVSGLLNNHPSRCIFQVKFNAPAPGDRGIYADDGASPLFLARFTAQPENAFPDVGSGFPGAIPSKFLRVVQSRNPGSPYLSAVCSLQLGFNATTAANDSGLLIGNLATDTDNAEREGTAAGATGLTYGQFTDQLAHFDTHSAYTTAVAGPAASNQAIFLKNNFDAPELVAQKGGAVTDGDAVPVPGVTFSSFLGVSTQDGGLTLFRAVITGTGVTPATNEGLWMYNSGTRRQILRKGIDLGANAPGFLGEPTLTGVKISKFLGFWQTNGQQIVHVQLAGAGVKASNDQALLLFQSSGALNQLLILLREGQAAPGCPGTKIGVISRVDVSSYWGQYVVLATLTGAAKGTDLALFRGASSKVVTPASQVLRQPVLVLRKGYLFENQPSRVKSIALPSNLLTAAGAGTTGLGSAMQETSGTTALGKVALIIDFEHGVRQIMNGIP